MKGLARGYLWLPSMDSEIRVNVTALQYHFFTHRNGQRNPGTLILVDAHSKWLDVHITSLYTLQTSAVGMGPSPTWQRNAKNHNIFQNNYNNVYV